MSNYGLQNYFKQEKIRFIRAKVGDKHVKEQMKKNRFNLGGEQSGHIILGKFATTGDGLLVALEVLFSMKKGKKASELFNIFKSTPQVLENIEVKDKSIINSTKCKKAIKKANKKKIQEHLDNSLMLVTALNKHIGYDNSAKIAKAALKNNTTLKHETLKTGLITEKDYNKIVDPNKMIYPA